MKILIFLLTVFAVGLSVASDRIETSIGGFVQNATNTDDTNQFATAIVGSIYHTGYPVDIGLEVIASDNPGGFVIGRVPLGNNFNIGIGIGSIGYRLDNYWAKPIAYTINTEYKTQYGSIVAKFIYSESSRDYSNGPQSCVHTNAPPDYHLDSCTGGGTTSTYNKRNVFMLGFQKEL